MPEIRAYVDVLTDDGKEIKTRGVPRDFDVVDDPGKRKPKSPEDRGNP